VSGCLRNCRPDTPEYAVLIKGGFISIEREESDKSLCSHIEIGKRNPLHCTAVGKAMMDYLSKDEVHLIVKEKGLEKFTENTITTKEDLENEFKKIREQGYAVDNMEHEEGVRCVAGPIRDYSGRVIAGMSVSGPAFRIDESNIPNIAKKVKEDCNCISKKMGYINSNTKYSKL